MLHAKCQDLQLPPAQRYVALLGSLARIARVIEQRPSFRHRSTFSRIASKAGQREIAAKVLIEMVESGHQGKELDMSEPFLAPCERFENIPFGESSKSWAMCALHEQFIILHAHSSFYKTPQAIHMLQFVEQQGYLGPDMRRRLAVARRRLERK